MRRIIVFLGSDMRFNTLRVVQNNRHILNDILEYILLTKRNYLWFDPNFTCVFSGPIANKSPLTQHSNHWPSVSEVTLETKQDVNSWWRQKMETFSALLALCAGKSTVPGEFPSQRSLICPWINGRVNNRQAGDLRQHSAHIDVTVMCMPNYWAIPYERTTTLQPIAIYSPNLIRTLLESTVKSSS